MIKGGQLRVSKSPAVRFTLNPPAFAEKLRPPYFAHSAVGVLHDAKLVIDNAIVRDPLFDAPPVGFQMSTHALPYLSAAERSIPSGRTRPTSLSSGPAQT